MDLSYWLESIDLYCERAGPGFWAEPVNALTNLAFIAAGVWGLSRVNRRGADTFSVVLCWWAIAIGIGSGLFHTFANRITIWADILPIATFIIVYLLFDLRRLMGLSWAKSIAVTVIFFAVTLTMAALMPQAIKDATNQSTGYLPAFLGLFVFGGLLLSRGIGAGWYNIVGGVIFSASVTFRIIDPRVCDSFPLGSHFMWHVLNGLLLAVLLAAVARYGAPSLTPRR
jgi:hypothetical protein